MASWKVFPISAGQKTPALAGDWRKHATDDQAQIDAWLATGYDLGVDCGASGLLVIDIDGEIGEQTAAGLDLPRTYTVRTRSGGRHLYYAGLGPSSVRKLGPGVDTRSTGGYVVWDAPDYHVLEDQVPAPAPAWILPALNAQKDHKAATSDALDLPTNLGRARDYLSIRRPAVEGQGGNDHTYQTAAALRDLGVSAEAGLDLMLEAWNGRCDPPWDADELAGIVDNAYRYAQNEAGAQALGQDPRTRFSGVGHDGLHSDSPAHGRYRLWSVPEALTRPPPTWIFPGILPAQAVGVAYGPQEVGKTWLVLDQALHCATGAAGYGRQQSHPQDVVYFSGEGFDDLVHSRVNAWAAHHQHGLELPHFHLLEDFPNVSDDNDVDLLINEVTKRALRPALIVLDTYSRVLAEAGLNENDPLDVMKFVRQAEVLKRGFGCTVLAIHHAGKELERGARGSNALMAAVDFAYEITADWSVKALQLSCAKMKAAKRFDPLHFEAIPEGDSLAMRGITPEAYRALTRVEDEFSSARIGAALARLGATSSERAVSVHTLATALYTPGVSEPEQEIQAKIDRVVRKLNALGKGRLEQYRSTVGWHLP